MKLVLNCAVVCVAFLSTSGLAKAGLLFSNGGVNNGVSTTGVTAGDPISAPEVYLTSGGLNFTTAGTNIKGYAGADDFALPVDSLLSTFTVYAYQSQSSSLAG